MRCVRFARRYVSRGSFLASGLLVVVFLGAAAPAGAITITRVSSPVFYMDSGDSLYAAYAAYRVVNDGGTGYDDLWAQAATFAGPQVSLAPQEDGWVRLGALDPGDTTYAYFYLEAGAPTAVSETHQIRVYEGAPPGGALLGSQSFGLTVEGTIAAGTNQVTSATNGPNPPGIGGTLTVTVTGETGTIGSPTVFAMTPSAFLNWPADALRLTDVVMVMTGSGNAGTYRHGLYYLLPATTNTQFVIVYTFQVVGLTVQSTRYFPVQYISSGGQIKHTGNINPFSIPPILPANNHLTATKSATPTLLTAADTVTYTVTLANASPSLALSAEEIRDTLPSAPGSAVYVPGTTTYQGLPVSDPEVTGQSLVFLGPFPVSAAGTGFLTYRALIPGTLGTYTNRASGLVGALQIDRTLNPSDDDPAVAAVTVTEPEIGLAKRILSAPINRADGTYSLTYALVAQNSGDVGLDSVQVTDDLAATFSGASAFTMNSITVASGPVTANFGYTGVPPNTRLLAGTDVLPSGVSAEIRISVTVTPGANLGPYANSAAARAVGAGEVVTDLSVNGAVPDANGNGDPTDDTGSTGLTFSESPELGVAKRVVSGPVNQGDGSYSLAYAFTLQNSGDVEIRGLRLIDNLAGAFAAADSFRVTNLLVTSGSLTPDSGFTGVSPDTDLLVGTDVLPAGGTASLRVNLTVYPGTTLGPYGNSATGSGTSPAGAAESDVSVNGAVPDANGNGDPGDDASLTNVTFVEAPVLGLAKRVLSAPVNHGDGSYTLTYAFVLENSGDVDIRNVRISDNLVGTFGGAAFSVGPVVVTSGPLTPNPAFTGTGGFTGLLSGFDTLPQGVTATVEFPVTVSPGTNLGPYNNSSVATGTTPAGAGLADLSTNGSVPDANGNGVTNDDSVPTPVTFTEAPELGAAKRVLSAPVNNGDGTFTFTYRILVENSGDVEVRSLQIAEDLAVSFTGSAGFSVDAVTVASGSLTRNPGFTGVVPNTALLTGVDELAPGGSAALDLTVTVTPGANLGPYSNRATATGSSPAGTALSDVSTQGAIPDANGNGNPNDDSASTLVSFSENPEIGLAKALQSGPINHGDGTYTVTFRFVMGNSGDVALTAVSLTDNLSAVFGAASGWTVDDISTVSGPVTPNPAFTGSPPNTNLLSGADVLGTGQQAIVDLTVTVTPGSALGPFGNTALVGGTSPAATLVTDSSANGTVPDVNGNGDPTDDTSSTPVTFTEAPSLVLGATVVGGPISNGDGTYTLSYGLTLQNSGDVELRNLFVGDNLAAAFTGVDGIVVDNVLVTGGALTPDPRFTGVTPDTMLLAGTDVLAPGAGASLEVTITVTPGSALGPHVNFASAGGVSPAGANVIRGDTAPPVTFTEAPELGAAKQLVAGPTNNGDGSYSVSYALILANSGDVEVRDLQLRDDLAATFAGATGFTMDALTVTSGGVTPNPTYTGIAPNTALLLGSNTLAPGASASLRLTVTVVPGADLGPYANSALASGTSPGGAALSDVSADGAVPDADGNGDPGNDAAPTNVTFSEAPELGLAKRVATGPVSNGDGTFSLSFEFRLENSGDVPLRNVQITDDLATAFPGVLSIAVAPVTVISGTLTPNPAYTGIVPQTALLAGTNTLAPGTAGIVRVGVTVRPELSLGPFANTALATASSPSGTAYSDLSTNGAVPDANGNGNPNDDSGPTLIVFTGTPELGLAKRLFAGPTSNGDGSYTVVYRFVLENSGDLILDNLQIEDDLDIAFSGAVAFTVDAISAVSGGLTPNPAFTGVSPQVLLLAGTDRLDPGSSGEVDLTVTVTPGSNLGPHANVATARGLAPNAVSVIDISTDGADPDANGNGDPGDDAAPTPVTFTESPRLGGALAVVTGPTPNGDGTHTLTYLVTVRNAGDVEIRDLQIGQNLGASFASALGFTADAVTVSTGTLVPNPGFTGSAPDTNLLSAGQTLAPGSTASLRVTVTVDPGDQPGPYFSQLWISGTSPGGVAVMDASTAGTDPDPDGNGDPGDDSQATAVTFALAPPTLLVEKHADRDEAVVGDFVMYRVNVSNVGVVPVTGAVLRDVIPAGFVYQTGTARRVDPGPDGSLDTVDDVTTAFEPTGVRPLDFPAIDLTPGEDVRFTYRLRVGAGVTFGEYANRATPLFDDAPIGNTATATVRVGADPLFDQTTILGKVFQDRDGDGWQDPTTATGITIQGGFPRAAYRINSTSIDRGMGAENVPDRRGSSGMLEGMLIEELPSRKSLLEEGVHHRVIIEVVLEEPTFAPIDITTKEGTHLHMSAEGAVTRTLTGAAGRGQDGQALNLSRRVEISRAGTRVIYTLSNDALEEAGIPGVRVVTPEGLVMETDALGRFHLADVDGGRMERGRNVILKVDPSTLPPGTTFTTENPRLLRITPSLMDKVNFGVRMPEADEPSEARQELPGGGAAWVTVDHEGLEPRLEVATPEVALLPGRPSDSLPSGGTAHSVAPDSVVRFTIHTNYAAFLDRWEIAIYGSDDLLLTRPLRILSGSEVHSRFQIPWNGTYAGGRVAPGETYLYVLRVFDAAGRRDETAVKPVSFAAAGKDGLRKQPLAEGETTLLEGAETFDGQSLSLRTIPVDGARVRIHGTGADARSNIQVSGAPVPRATDGSFAVETLLPVGVHRIPLAVTGPDSVTWERPIEVAVPEERFFMVGIADVTMGHNAVSGSMEPLAVDDHFDEDVFVDGRLAFHLKGKVKGKYLMTAHLDTGEDGIEDLFDNLGEKDSRTFLRHLDPDRYYPVYGDESTTLVDAESQGKLYARMEWDRSSVVWGNFQTGLTGSEFAQYDRSLYGAKLAHRSLAADDLGAPRTELTAFASEQQTAMAHDEFRGTGGSLYYLNHADVVEGSQKVWVEVRDRDSDRVLRNTALVLGRDYEIDEIQGRIILSRPLNSVADQVAPSIVRDEPLDGDAVLLLVDYEYVPEGFDTDNMTYGVRAKGNAGDVVGLGGTYAHENRDGTDYELRGVDGALRSGRGTYLKGEYAESEARQATSGRYSTDGGLTFGDLPGAAFDSTTEGTAMGVEARLDVGELTGGATDVSATGWWKEREAGFNTARLETGVDRTETGGEFLARFSKNFSLAGRGSSLDEEGVRTDRRYGIQADLRVREQWTLSAEGRRTEDRPEIGDARDASLGGLRLAYDVLPDVQVYGSGQATLSRSDAYEENNLGTVGVAGRYRDFLGARAEGSMGSRGDAVRVDLDLAVSERFRLEADQSVGSLDPRTRLGTDWRLARDHEVYGTYTLSPDRTEGKRGVLTLGQRKALGSQLNLFTENQFSQSEARTGLATVFGLDFRPSNRWTLGLSVERSRLDDDFVGDVDRDVISVSAGLNEGKTKGASKLEYRRDRGGARRTQWLTTNRADYSLGDDWRFTGKFSLSTTQDELDSRGDARFVESGVGAAYRPGRSDRWQLLGKYSFLLDLPSLGQMPLVLDERMHVVSTEGLVDITSRIGVGAKAAGRWAQEREGRNAGGWYASNKYLLVARGRYHVIRGWDALAEYRWLRALDGESMRHGALLGLYRALSANLQAGAGFNFTSFTDDLTQLDYDNRGVFVNLVGTY